MAKRQKIEHVVEALIERLDKVETQVAALSEENRALHKLIDTRIDAHGADINEVFKTVIGVDISSAFTFGDIDIDCSILDNYKEIKHYFKFPSSNDAVTVYNVFVGCRRVDGMYNLSDVFKKAFALENSHRVKPAKARGKIITNFLARCVHMDNDVITFKGEKRKVRYGTVRGVRSCTLTRVPVFAKALEHIQGMPMESAMAALQHHDQVDEALVSEIIT